MGQPFKDLLVWLDLVPLNGLAQVLDTAFFPQWHAAMRTWLRDPECDYGEVIQWYQGWRALIPNALCENSSVRKQLDHGLAVMKHLMSNGGQDEAEASPASPASLPKSPVEERAEETSGVSA